MEIIKDTLKIDKKAGTAAAQLLSEGEIMLDGDKADIAEVLRCGCRLVIDDESVSDGRVSLGGKLNVTGIYTDMGKNLHSFETEAPVSDIITVDGAKEGMTADVSCTVTSCDCRKMNERKIYYKVICDVTATVRSTEEYDYVSGIEGIAPDMSQTEHLSAEHTAVHTSDSISIRDTLTLPMGKPNIGELLCCDTSISSVEQKAGSDSLRLSGELNVSVLYKGEGESNPMELYEGTVPFKGELAADGLDESMLTDVKLDIAKSDITAAADEDGELRIIDVDVTIAVKINALTEEDAEVLKDVYIINKDTELNENTVEGQLLVAKNESRCPVKEVVTLNSDAPDMLQIYKADGRPYIDFVGVADDVVRIDGAIAVNILYVTGNDDMPVYCDSSVIPFSHTAQTAGSKEGMDCNVSAQLEHIGFNMLSDREVEIRCVVNLCTTVEKTVDYELADNVSFSDRDSSYLDSLASITLYVVKKGDTLWQLAKKFNSTVDDIASINDIENPDLIYPGQKLIIVKKYK